MQENNVHLCTKQNNSDNTDPTVKTVHIWNLIVVMETKNSNQTNNDKYQRQSM